MAPRAAVAAPVPVVPLAGPVHIHEVRRESRGPRAYRPDMRQHSPTDARDLQRRLPDRVMTALRRYRRGGRRARALRRSAALALLVCAAVLASSGRPPAVAGIAVMVAARDMDAGAHLTARDLRTSVVSSPPDGAIDAASPLAGRALASPVRRGEILTDVRLLDASGPRPGAGRVAVPVHVSDAAVAELLRPGMHVAMVAVSADQPARTQLLTTDAVVLSVAAPGTGPLAGGNRDHVVVVAVPAAAADAVTAAGLTGAIAVRFR